MLRKRILSSADYIEGILKGDKIRLAQAITLVESTLPAHLKIAEEIITACLPYSNQSIRIAITGSPGVGKSTFIESLGLHIIEHAGRKPAVLAIDPSSQLNKGSILGDKTRMEGLSHNNAAFIRPSPAGTSLGGVARKTRETIILCEAAGYDTIIIETVGVGQSEIKAKSMSDVFLLLLLPGAGDELQGIKRGIVEMADIIAVNKSDKERQILARQAQRSYKNALHLFPIKANDWSTPVLTCSAIEHQGIKEIWDEIQKYIAHCKSTGYFDSNRRSQSEYWFEEATAQFLEMLFYATPSVKDNLNILKDKVLNNELSPFNAAYQLMEVFKKNIVTDF